MSFQEWIQTNKAGFPCNHISNILKCVSSYLTLSSILGFMIFLKLIWALTLLYPCKNMTKS